MERGDISKLVASVNEYYDEYKNFIDDIYCFSNYLHRNPIYTKFEEIPNYRIFLTLLHEAVKAGAWDDVLRLSKCHFLFKATKEANACGYYFLSKAYQNLGCYSIAMIFAKKALSLCANDIMLGQLLENHTKNFSILSDDAIFYFVKKPLGILSFSHAINAAIKIKNNNPQVLLNAIIDKEPSLYRENRNKSSAYVYMAGAFFAYSKNYQEIALFMIDKAIERDPGFGDAYFLKGLIISDFGIGAYASFFDKAIENKSKFVWPYYFSLKKKIGTLSYGGIKEIINTCRSKFDYDLIGIDLENYIDKNGEYFHLSGNVFKDDFDVHEIVVKRFLDGRYDLKPYYPEEYFQYLGNLNFRVYGDL